MNRAERAVRRLDRAQQNHAWLSFPVAVWKKFGDDSAGNLAALIAYYAFASLFPLLLVFVTVLNIVLHNNAALRDQLLDSAYAQFPGLGQDLKNNVHSLSTTGIALVIGLIFTFLGARGVANAVQTALNRVWAVPYSRRPGFPWNQLRSIGVILSIGLGVIATSVLSGFATSAGSVLGGAAAHIGAIVVSLLVTIGVFWLGFRLATARDVTTRELFPGALGAGVVWQILLLTGTYFVSHELARTQSLYGIFGIVLGLLAWLYLQAQLTLYAVEASVVHARKLWPRSLAPPLTPQDRRAYALYASAAQRNADERIRIDIEPPAPPRAAEPRGGEQPTGRPPADGRPAGGQPAGGQRAG
jgi:YihY family inner membrane protein